MIQKNKLKKILLKAAIAKRKTKGFSLVETLLAVFIFSLAMVMVAGAFASFFKSYSGARKLQRNLEAAQFSMNIMAKTIRTSKIIASTASDIRVWDYSRASNNCLGYKIAAGKLQSGSNAAADETACTATPLVATDYSDFVSNVMGGSFAVDPSTTAPDHKGKVTVALNIGDATASTVIQTSVSLRQ